MKKWFKSNSYYLVGAVLGAIAGYLYWQQVGCASGTCAITSSPFNSTVYGAILGGLFLSLFKREKESVSLKQKLTQTENEI
ncbi:MAG: hypothetical protein IPK62_07620 [Bacteroidetes bacterium]|nr:hypothetical protein [Bacteroidota bacterium]MBK8144862.1 hypothetical protein [Bacteroidota bacterium]MBP6314292.1 hypothetical protein [Chitinophagaceae bacterium]